MSDVTRAVGQLLTAEMLLSEYYGAAQRAGDIIELEAGAIDVSKGQARRLYEGVWDHLDAARAILAADGRDVSAYDHHRRAPIAGAANLRPALASLSAALPEIDWDAARRATAEVPESARTFELSRGAGALIVLTAGAVLGWVLALVLGGSTSPGEACDHAAVAVVERVGEVRLCTGGRGADALACGAVEARRSGDRLRSASSGYPAVDRPLDDAAAGLDLVAAHFDRVVAGEAGGGDDGPARLGASIDALRAVCGVSTEAK